MIFTGLKYLSYRVAALVLTAAVSAGVCSAAENRSISDAFNPWEDGQLEQRGFSSCVLVLKVVGLDPPSGILRLAVYDSKKSYNAKRHAARSAHVEISSSNCTIKFEGLKPGEYAVMMYHDTNRNNRFDRFLGLPREQYGFSNNRMPGFSPPDFDQVKFKVAAGKWTFLKITAR